MFSSTNEVFEFTNFERIHAYMVLTNWTWNNNGVPTRDNLYATANKLLSLVEQSSRDCAFEATGGFSAFKITRNDGQVVYDLIFDIS